MRSPPSRLLNPPPPPPALGAVGATVSPIVEPVKLDLRPCMGGGSPDGVVGAVTTLVRLAPPIHLDMSPLEFAFELLMIRPSFDPRLVVPLAGAALVDEEVGSAPTVELVVRVRPPNPIPDPPDEPLVDALPASSPAAPNP